MGLCISILRIFCWKIRRNIYDKQYLLFTRKLVNNLNDIFNEVPLDKQFTMAALSIHLREKAKNENEESIQNSLNLLAYLCSPILSFDSKKNRLNHL